MSDQRQPRPFDVRAKDASERLTTATQMWLATGGTGSPHLIPVAVVYDDGQLVTATFERSKTVANVSTVPRARVALGTTADVVMVDASVGLVPVARMDASTADRFAAISHDPRVMPGFTYLRLTPRRIQVWNGFHEFGGRTVMQAGRWLSEPID